MQEQEYIERVEALKGKLYRTAYLYLGSEAHALDAVDETVYKGLCAHKKLRQPEYFDTWLTRILINVSNTEAETARALGLPPGTVSTRQRKALSLLKLELSEEV